jgi:hypothetical protein
LQANIFEGDREGIAAIFRFGWQAGDPGRRMVDH